MTEPIEPEIAPENVQGRETEDLRPVPAGKAGVHWNAMRIALAIVILVFIVFFAWLFLR
jgi:hypothetical protein